MNKFVTGAICVSSIALVMAVFGATTGQAQGNGNGDSRVVRGFEIAPVPLNMDGLNHAKVGLGSYLVNTGGCGDCHTAPTYAEGGDPFLHQPKVVNAARYLAGGAPFGPFITSRNLTPRANGLPANLTLEQFIQVMRTGIDLKNRHPQISDLLQVMPWPVYQEMSNNELDAIYEYLRAIPSLPTIPN